MMAAVLSLEQEVHSLAERMRELEQLADAHDFHGRRTLRDATLERRESVQHQRSLMLRELFLERQLGQVWRR